MANVRTHALTKKATLLAQRLARRRVNVKMKNLSISRSRPIIKYAMSENTVIGTSRKGMTSHKTLAKKYTEIR